MRKMSTMMKHAAALGLAASMCLSFVSCEDKLEGYTMTDGYLVNENATAMVVILGKHANAMEIPADAYDQIEDMLDDVVYGGYISAIIVDGDPTKIDIVDDKDFFAQDARNTSVALDRIEKRKTEIRNVLESLPDVADSEEVDLLAAIREATNVLSGSDASDAANKRIVIVDTGISTTGDLNFYEHDYSSVTKPDIQKDIMPTLTAREGMNILPDLSNIDVTFIGTNDGLAEVASPQKAETTDKKYIKQLWTEVITACNAKSYEHKAAAGWSIENEYTEDKESIFKFVSPVMFAHESIYVTAEGSDYDPDAEPNFPNPPVVEVKLASEMVGFKEGSGEYKNPDNTERILRPYAEQLKEFFAAYPEQKIWIAGTTAGVDRGDGEDQRISSERAEAVKNTLVEFGVPADKLLTISLGCEFPWKANEEQNGEWKTELAQENRTVVIFSVTENTVAGSENYYKQLKEAYEKGELMEQTMIRFKELNNQ